MKIIISDINQTHANDVRDSFIAGYESDGGTWGGVIEIRLETIPNLVNSFEYAKENGFEMVIRSTVGAKNYLTMMQEYYFNDGILSVMPAGQQLPNTDNGLEELPATVLTGFVEIDGTDNNGAKIVEFIGIDPIHNQFVSFSNGFIAGQLAYIKTETNETWTQVRERARLTATQSGNFTRLNGFGKIQIAEAVQLASSEEIEIPEVEINNGYIIYDNKVTSRVLDLPDVNKVKADDMNEIKSKFNQAKDELTVAQENIEILETLNAQLMNEIETLKTQIPKEWNVYFEMNSNIITIFRESNTTGHLLELFAADIGVVEILGASFPYTIQHSFVSDTPIDCTLAYNMDGERLIAFDSDFKSIENFRACITLKVIETEE